MFTSNGFVRPHTSLMSNSFAIASPVWIERHSLREFVLRAVGEVLFWLIVVQLVTGLYLQTQLALFGGRIVVPNGFPKLVLVIGIVAMAAALVLARGGELAVRRSMLPACLF